MKYQFTKARLVLLAMLLFSSAAMAQFTASGTVKDANGEPLIGATVLVKGTAIGTITDIDGTFELNVPGETATLLVSYTGFSEKEIEVSKASSRADVTLADEATQLDEVVVTGLATSLKRSNLANSVEQVSARELTGITTQQTMDGALYGKFKGANISANSGAPGGGITVKLRGITTFNGNSQPLYIVDGVYYDNSAFRLGLDFVSASQAGGSQTNQDNPTSRIADLDPEDIETIEILKGASAAAIYGSRAASGVVIVTTKRGAAGKTTVTLSQSVGANLLLTSLGQRDWDATKVATHFGQAEVAVFNAGTIHDYEKEIYGNTGLVLTSRVEFSGGTDKTKYFAGFTRKDEEGIVKNTGYDKNSFRLNLDQQLSKWLSASLSSNYIESDADRGFFNNDNTSTTIGISYVSTPPWAELFADENGNFPNNPYAPSNFLQTASLVTNRESVRRFVGGALATASLIQQDNQSLKLHLRGGVDYYNFTNKGIFPRELQFQSGGNGTDGVSIYGTAEARNNNSSAFLVHSLFTGTGLNFRTQLGVTQEKVNINFAQTIASFLVAGQTNIDQASSRQTEQRREVSTDRGFFAQEEVNINDKIVVTVGIRGDKSSRNGDANKLYYYPKASVALNIHKFVDLETSPLSTAKLRAAYGQSGNFAPFGAIYSNFVPVIIDGSTGSLINNARGNPDLEPERQTELELGLDFGLFNNSVLLDFTYYNKSVDDLILPTQQPTSSGFTTYWLNAAEIENKGFEIGLDLTPVESEMLTWNSRVSFWKNTAEVTRLDVPAFNTGAFGATLGTYRIETGKSPTQLVGRPVVEGVPTVWGDAEPDFQTSFLNTLLVGNFEFSFLVHWKKGGDNVNLTTLLSDLFGTSPDFDDTDLDPDGAASNGNYRLANLGVSAQPWIESSAYVRVREIALSYKIPRTVLGDIADVKLGVSGRNLFNWFDYNSYDPEVSNFGTGAISSSVEVTPFPSAKSVFFNLRATF